MQMKKSENEMNFFIWWWWGEGYENDELSKGQSSLIDALENLLQKNKTKENKIKKFD